MGEYLQGAEFNLKCPYTSKYWVFDHLTKNSFTHGQRTGPFFSKFYAVRFSQRWLYYHLKIFKKYEFPQNLKVVAQKLCPPRSFQFWTSQGCGSPIFWDIPLKFSSLRDFLLTKKWCFIHFSASSIGKLKFKKNCFFLIRVFPQW